MAKKGEFLTYKGRPLVRKDNVIYYGDMAEKGDLEVADKVSVQLMDTDPDTRPKERIIKKSEKTGLYNAMDIGAIWLERELSK